MSFVQSLRKCVRNVQLSILKGNILLVRVRPKSQGRSYEDGLRASPPPPPPTNSQCPPHTNEKARPHPPQPTPTEKILASSLKRAFDIQVRVLIPILLQLNILKVRYSD